MTARRIPVPFVGGAYSGRSTHIDAQTCQNWFPVFDKEGGKPQALLPCPGLDLFSAAPSASEVRALHFHSQYLFPYAVIGNTVQRYSQTGTRTALTGTLNTSSGTCQMAHNPTQVMIVDGTNGYIATGADVVTQIADPDFPQVVSVTYQDGYFIVARKSSNRFYISALNDGTSWDALDYAAKEAYPDIISCVKSVNRELWLIGTESYEVWYNSGASSFPFERVPGAVNRIGARLGDTVASYGGVIFLMANDYTVKRSEGYNFVKISTDQIDYQLKATDSTSAYAFAYGMEGHVFYVLTLPIGNKTFVYDLTTGLWHTRASASAEWRAKGLAFFAGKNVVGDATNGVLYELNLSTYDEYQSGGNQVITKQRTAQPIVTDRNWLFHRSVEVEFAYGIDETVTLSWSDDGGVTFSSGVSQSISGKRVVWRRLGKSRDRLYRISSAADGKVVIIGAWLEAEEASS